MPLWLASRSNGGALLPTCLCACNPNTIIQHSTLVDNGSFYTFRLLLTRTCNNTSQVSHQGPLAGTLPTLACFLSVNTFKQKLTSWVMPLTSCLLFCPLITASTLQPSPFHTLIMTNPMMHCSHPVSPICMRSLVCLLCSTLPPILPHATSHGAAMLTSRFALTPVAPCHLLHCSMILKTHQ